MNSHRSRILAIDDTPANLMTLGSALESEFKLQIATSGEMGLRLAAESPPDIILLDVMMPEMDGYETCRRLKADPKLKSIPVVFVTALHETTAETKGLALGAADFITKPINIEVARHRIRNLMEQDRLRKTVEASNRALEQDIAERTQVEAELKRSNSELEQFSYAISHDMRQPLRMISGHLTLLVQSIGEHLEDEQRESLRFAIEGAQRLDQMLVGLLEYSRVGRKGEPTVLLESRDLLQEALLFLEPAIEEANAQISIQGVWPRVSVSRDESVRLLQNLIGNAVKFRVPGRRPEITVTSEITEHAWHVCIADNGVGILPAQAERLFQVFQRLQSRTTYEGTGIGLALCRKIAEHHRGRIWAESAGEDQGSRFCFTLPSEDAATPGLPVFDDQYLLNQFDGDRQLAITIIQSAMGDMPDYFNKLEQAIVAEQWPTAERLTHTLKGLTAQLGGSRLSARMKVANDRLKAGGTVNRDILSALLDDYQQLADTLSDWIG